MKINFDRRENPKRTRQGGFTLLELMVVIVIIALLAAIVMPRFLGATDKARVGAAKAQISSFKQALGLYKLEFKKYPTTSEGLEALVNNEQENFLDQDNIPKDPWDNDYVYTSPGTQNHDFEIVSYGADGQPGGADKFDKDIVSWDLQGED